MSESLAGVTLLAFGNGSPDVFSTFAAMSSNSGSLAVGELIGAAGFITAVVAGSMALVREFKVGKKTFVRDVGCFVVAASFSMVFLADGHLYLWECFTMVAFYISYVVSIFSGSVAPCTELSHLHREIVAKLTATDCRCGLALASWPTSKATGKGCCGTWAVPFRDKRRNGSN